MLKGPDEFRFLRAAEKLASLDVGYVIGTLLQIGSDMGGIENAPFPTLDQLPE